MNKGRLDNVQSRKRLLRKLLKNTTFQKQTKRSTMLYKNRNFFPALVMLQCSSELCLAFICDDLIEAIRSIASGLGDKDSPSTQIKDTFLSGTGLFSVLISFQPEATQVTNPLSSNFFTTSCPVAFSLPFLLSWKKNEIEFEKEQKSLQILKGSLFFMY